MKKLILLILLLTLSSNLFAVDIKVVFTKGDNFKIEEDEAGGEEAKPLRKNDYLHESHSVATGRNGFVLLRIAGHSNIRLEANTKIVINQLPYFYEDSKEIEREASFILEFGNMFVDMDRKFDTEALTIKSRNSVLGVRGTKFLVGRDEKSNDVLLTVKSGQVEIKNNISQQNDFVLPNESIVVANDKNFTAKQKYKFQNDIDWEINNPKAKKGFKQLSQAYRQEFKAKRKSWKVNKKQRQKLKNAWKVRTLANLDKTKSLKPSSIYKQRRQRIRTIRENREFKRKHNKKRKKKLRMKKAEQTKKRVPMPIKNPIKQIQKRKKIRNKIDKINRDRRQRRRRSHQ